MFIMDIFPLPNTSDSSNNINSNNNNNNNYFNRVYLCICKPKIDKYGIFEIAYKPFTSIEEAEMYNRVKEQNNSITKIIPLCKYTPSVLDNVILGYKFKDYIKDKLV